MSNPTSNRRIEKILRQSPENTGLLFSSAFFIRTWQGLEDAEERREALQGMKEIKNKGKHSMNPIRQNCDRFLEVFAQFSKSEQEKLYSLVHNLVADGLSLEEQHVFDTLFGPGNEIEEDSIGLMESINFRYLMLALPLFASLFVFPISRVLDFQRNMAYVRDCLTLSTNVDPWEVMIFNSMGIWPLTSVSFFKRDSYSIPFILLSMGLGMFSFSFYLVFVLRLNEESRLCMSDHGFERRPLFISLQLSMAISLLMYGVWYGNMDKFSHAISTNPVTFITLCDFAAFSIASIDWTRFDAQRHGLSKGWAVISMIPLSGAILYLNLSAIFIPPTARDSRKKD